MTVKDKSSYAPSGMKRLGVFLLLPGWDASPSQGYPPPPLPASTKRPGWKEAL